MRRRGQILILAVVAAGMLLSTLVSAVAGRQDWDGCGRRLNAIAAATFMYLRDYDETFPPMSDRAAYEGCLRPYREGNSDVKDAELTCPRTHQLYEANPRLDRYLLVWPLEKTPMVRDAAAHAADSASPYWIVAYADGHVGVSHSQPAFDKPGPMPARVKEIVVELKRLRRSRPDIVNTIRELEAEEKGLKAALRARGVK